jgi:hypothetical protein
MMKKDVFENECRNPLLWILIGVVILANYFAQDIQHIIETLFFFTLGGLCLFNFNRCGRVHCQITGYGFVGVGIVALLNILGAITVNWSNVWIIFIIVLIVGYGLEFLYKGKKGTCYKK